MVVELESCSCGSIIFVAVGISDMVYVGYGMGVKVKSVS